MKTLLVSLIVLLSFVARAELQPVTDAKVKHDIVTAVVNQSYGMACPVSGLRWASGVEQEISDMSGVMEFLLTSFNQDPGSVSVSVEDSSAQPEIHIVYQNENVTPQSNVYFLNLDITTTDQGRGIAAISGLQYVLWSYIGDVNHGTLAHPDYRSEPAQAITWKSAFSCPQKKN